MKYVVIASYRKPTAPMPHEDAVQLVQQFRTQEINCHIQKASNVPWNHNAPHNPQFLGAQPARAGQDY